MKVLWLCNMVPGKVRAALGGTRGGGLWVDHVLEDILKMGTIQLKILCYGSVDTTGQLEHGTQYRVFREGLPYVYSAELEHLFCQDVREFRPDVVHIWGTEFGHTLAMVNACKQCGILDRVVTSIQGLCSVCAQHYCEGVPDRVRYGYTLRDFLKRENLNRQAQIFARRGELECRALEQVSHVIGRTPLDRFCTQQIQPKAEYHFCNETLRSPFYEGQWTYSGCTKHRIFASNYYFPYKGFHYLLEAFAIVLKTYPDATLSVPGNSFLNLTVKGRLRQQRYHAYLRECVRKYAMEDKVLFLGDLSAEEMKQAYLASNVFALPSTIENSPNSLGEAMLLGVPCVAADVGGVTTMLKHGQEGFVYPASAPYQLAGYIETVFAMEEQAEALGFSARAHALRTHDPETNLKALLDAYARVARSF